MITMFAGTIGPNQRLAGESEGTEIVAARPR